MVPKRGSCGTSVKPGFADGAPLNPLSTAQDRSQTGPGWDPVGARSGPSWEHLFQHQPSLHEALSTVPAKRGYSGDPILGPVQDRVLARAGLGASQMAKSGSQKG